MIRLIKCNLVANRRWNFADGPLIFTCINIDLVAGQMSGCEDQWSAGLLENCKVVYFVTTDLNYPNLMCTH